MQRSGWASSSAVDPSSLVRRLRTLRRSAWARRAAKAAVGVARFRRRVGDRRAVVEPVVGELAEVLCAEVVVEGIPAVDEGAEVEGAEVEVGERRHQPDGGEEPAPGSSRAAAGLPRLRRPARCVDGASRRTAARRRGARASTPTIGSSCRSTGGGRAPASALPARDHLQTGLPAVRVARRKPGSRRSRPGRRRSKLLRRRKRSGRGRNPQGARSQPVYAFEARNLPHAG